MVICLKLMSKEELLTWCCSVRGTWGLGVGRLTFFISIPTEKEAEKEMKVPGSLRWIRGSSQRAVNSVDHLLRSTLGCVAISTPNEIIVSHFRKLFCYYWWPTQAEKWSRLHNIQNMFAVNAGMFGLIHQLNRFF